MLTQIHIRDLATIEELHLTLHPGSSMITGETGAGKSIFIEAIELGLGARASQNVVRTGKEKADISLSFDISQFPKVKALLQEMELLQEADTNECIIRRIVTADGRSRSFINGYPSTLLHVKELGELLFHLHGQHQQQVLLKSETQREMLDRYGDHMALAVNVKNLADGIKQLQKAITNVREKTYERAERCDFLRFQLDELTALNLQAGEWEQLENEHKRLTHAEELIRTLSQIQQQINADNNQNLLRQLNDCRKTIESIRNLEAKSGEWLQIINQASVLISELDSDLHNYLSGTEIDPEKLQLVEERVSQIFTLSRKHKVAPQDLYQFQMRLQNELDALNASDNDLKALEQKLKDMLTEYQQFAAQLSLARKNAALKLEKEITTTTRSLSLPHSEFKIHLDQEKQSEININGNEKIIFLIKTNPDQTLQPLAKVISGGELSRLSLAAHLALANRTTIPTLVFDEVDTGLSGATAEKIGKLIQKLGRSYQVFCITHQAQVAACGNHHILVEKYFVNNTTHTRLRALDEDERIREIARMLAGEKITEKTLAHAKEMMG